MRNLADGFGERRAKQFELNCFAFTFRKRDTSSRCCRLTFPPRFRWPVAGYLPASSVATRNTWKTGFELSRAQCCVKATKRGLQSVETLMTCVAQSSHDTFVLARRVHPFVVFENSSGRTLGMSPAAPSPTCGRSQANRHLVPCFTSAAPVWLPQAAFLASQGRLRRSYRCEVVPARWSQRGAPSAVIPVGLVLAR